MEWEFHSKILSGEIFQAVCRGTDRKGGGVYPSGGSLC